MNKNRIPVLLALTMALTASGSPKVLTTDPLTGLPLYPATDSRLHLGNEPTILPESTVCKSRVQAEFYSIYDSKISAAVTWYANHLSGFKKTHAYSANRSQDTFYKADGTLAVSVTGSSGHDGEETDAYSVVYSHFQPGLPERAVVSLNQQKLVCP